MPRSPGDFRGRGRGFFDDADRIVCGLAAADGRSGLRHSRLRVGAAHFGAQEPGEGWHALGMDFSDAAVGVAIGCRDVCAISASSGRRDARPEFVL